MRDWTHNFGAAVAIPPGTYTTDPAPLAVDRQGFNALSFVVTVEPSGDTLSAANAIAFVIEHSDDDVAFSPVVPDNVIGATADPTGTFLTLTAQPASGEAIRVGYVDGTIGDKQFVRLRAHFTGSHPAGTPISAIAILGVPRNAPVA